MNINPNLTLKINPLFIKYITDKILVFVSGCNIVLYDFRTKAQKFLFRKNKLHRITYLSIGSVKPQNFVPDNKISKSINVQQSQNNNEQDNSSDIRDKFICIGEFSDKENSFYITLIKPSNPNVQYTIKSKEPMYEINYCSILNNTHFCVSLSQKINKNKTSSGSISTKISFIKYSSESVVCEELIPENLTYCCYNPKNAIELVVCGKGYLRLWNIFINEYLKSISNGFSVGKKKRNIIL